MKKKILWAALMGTVLFTSCGDDKREFVEQFAQAASAKDMQTLAGMYPDSKELGEIALQYTPEQITISEEQEGQPIAATIGDVKIVMVRDAEGALKVQSTQGLLVVDAQKLEFAKSTGWYDPSATDKENAVALKDEGFVPYITSTLVSAIKDNMTVTWKKYFKDLYSSEYGGYSEHDCNDFTVTNNNNIDIPGEAYVIEAAEYNTHGEVTDDYYGTKNYKGKTVPAGGKVVITGPRWDACGGYSRFVTKIIFDTDYLMQMDLTQLGFTPTGNEYANYLSSK